MAYWNSSPTLPALGRRRRRPASRSIAWPVLGDVGLGRRPRRGRGRHGRQHPAASAWPLGGRPAPAVFGRLELARPPGPARRSAAAARRRAPARPRPRDVERLVEVHGERDRPAADQRQLHAVPVLLGRVLDDRPALQERRLLVVEHQPVAGLPDRRLLDIADADLALALADEAELDRLLVGVVAGGQHGQGLAQLGVELLVGQLDAADLSSLIDRSPSSVSRLRTRPRRPVSLSPTCFFCFSTPRIMPAIALGARPRPARRGPAPAGRPAWDWSVRSMAKLLSVLVIGSFEP